MMTDEQDLKRIEELRAELHRQMGGSYDPARIPLLLPISQELDRLVVKVTRRQWERAQGTQGTQTNAYR